MEGNSRETCGREIAATPEGNCFALQKLMLYIEHMVSTGEKCRQFTRVGQNASIIYAKSSEPKHIKFASCVNSCRCLL